MEHCGPDIHHGRLAFQAGSFRCSLGRSGIVDNKKEGDGGTPAGSWALESVLYRPDKWPGETLNEKTVPSEYPNRRPLSRTDGWSDDPADPAYNRPVRLPHGFSHEKLWREDGRYDVIVPLAYNRAPVIAGAGSAVFLHLTREDYPPTEGCVAVTRRDMQTLLPLLRAGSRMIVKPLPAGGGR